MVNGKLLCGTATTLIGLGLCDVAQATLWTGAGANTFWSTGANWSGNVAPGFGGLAEFAGAPTATMPNVNGVIQLNMGVDFQSAGWSIVDSVGTGGLRIDAGRSILSAGAGVNTVGVRLTGSGTGTVTFNVGTGNTLRLNGEVAFAQNRVLNGAGTLVFDGPNQATIGTGTWAINEGGTVLINNRAQMNGVLLATGRLGGTGTAVGYQFQTTTIDGATLAPGGNGTYGGEIGTLTFESNNASRHELVIADQGILEIQLGATVGQNDLLALSLRDAGGGNLAIQTGATLNLLGGAVQDGSYTIIQNLDADPIVGTFTNVNFNGVPIDPENITLTYSTNSVVVNVTGLVPEPTIVGCLGVLAIGTLRRRGR